MSIKEEIQNIINQKNFLDDKELEKQLYQLVWEVKRICMNKSRELLENIQKENLIVFPVDSFLVKLDEAVK